MKRVRCPKCDHFILFDETQYTEGQSLVFVCDNCQKQFSIRLGVSKLHATQREENQSSAPTEEESATFGFISVVENAFAYHQVIPLKMGDNLIGRRNKGTEVDIPIETNDPSMDRRHCYINVRQTKLGDIAFTLRDNNSNCGTFLNNDILSPKDRIRIYDGAIITLGATTIILHETEEQVGM